MDEEEGWEESVVVRISSMERIESSSERIEEEVRFWVVVVVVVAKEVVTWKWVKVN